MSILFLLLLSALTVESINNLKIQKTTKRKDDVCKTHSLESSGNEITLCVNCLNAGCIFSGLLKCHSNALIAKFKTTFSPGAPDMAIKLADKPSAMPLEYFCGNRLMNNVPSFRDKIQMEVLLRTATEMAKMAEDKSKVKDLCDQFKGSEDQAIVRYILETIAIIESNEKAKSKPKIEEFLGVISNVINPAKTVSELVAKLPGLVLDNVKKISLDIIETDANEVEIKNRKDIIELMLKDRESRKSKFKISKAIFTGKSNEEDIECDP
jgi:hypothetical protein